ncbi:MAG: oligosaccharide flippase family protein [Armatimonadetes bacterium]|nr:oligosaccharide flippase family protein [Armatimonadota bacterium]
MAKAYVCEETAQSSTVVTSGSELEESPQPSMRRNLSWTLFGNLVYTAFQWGILVVLAKLGTPETVGLFGLALAVTAPVMMFFNLELRSVQATDARGDYQFGHYLALRLATSVVALMIISAVALIGWGMSGAACVMIATGVAKAVESVSDVLYGLFQNRERMDRIAISMVTRGVLALLVLSAAVYFTRSAFFGVVAMAGAWLIVLLAYDMPTARAIVLNEEAARTRRLLSPIGDAWSLWRLALLSLPLGCAMMLVSLNVNVPRYFVQWQFGERELGFFVAVAYLMVAVSTVVNALGQAACPRLARYHSGGSDLRSFRILLGKLVAAIIVLSLMGVGAARFAGREILTILYRPEYADQADVFVWIMVASGVGGVGVILRYGCISARRFAVQLPLWIAIVASNAVACLLLIPRYGLKGAGMAMTASATVQVVGNLLILARANSADSGITAVARES